MLVKLEGTKFKINLIPGIPKEYDPDRNQYLVLMLPSDNDPNGVPSFDLGRFANEGETFEVNGTKHYNQNILGWCQLPSFSMITKFNITNKERKYAQKS